jgi:phage gpG-like protein
MADLDGFEEMMAALKAKQEAVQAATPRALSQAAHRVEQSVKRLLGASSHPPGTPTPSPPGAPPSLVTGNLRRSITVGDVEGRGTHWSVTVSSNLVYSRIQQFGGTAGRGAHLPARPYMTVIGPASGGIQRDFRAEWGIALRA